MTQERCDIIVLSDALIMREALVTLIETQPDFVVIGQIEQISGLTDQMASGAVVVIDGDASPPETVSAFRTDYPFVRLVLLKQRPQGAMVLGALRLGTHGLVAKEVSAGRLFEAIRVVSAGATFFDIGEGVEAEHERADAPALTRRERAVIGHLAAGKTNTEIGQAVHISPSTVKYHLSNIFGKLDVPNRAQAVSVAYQQGLF